MRIIISPAKKMNVDTDSLPRHSLPQFSPRAAVRFMAENAIQATGDIKSFDRLNYRYCEKYSDENTYVFILRGN